jgi:hypothetical protein
LIPAVGLEGPFSQVPKILAATAETSEAEPALELYGSIRIAFAGGDGIAEPGNEDVTYGDVGCHPLSGAVAERNVHRRQRGSAGAHA